MTKRTRDRITTAVFWAVAVAIPIVLALLSPDAAAGGLEFICTGGIRG